MRSARRLGRIAAFSINPLIGALVPLLAVPVIVSSHGAQGWSAIAIGQSLGAGGAVLVELGWALNGPQRVARRERPQLLFDSIIVRLAMLAIVLVAVVPAAALIAPSERAAAALSAAAYAAFGLSNAWYFTGRGRPLTITVVETIPRVLAVVLSIVALSVGAPLVVNPALILASALLAPVLGFLSVRGDRRVRFTPVASLWRSTYRQRSAIAGRAMSATYIALPTAIVGLVAPSSVAVFAAVERVMRMGLMAIQAVPNSMQQWVGTARGRQQIRERVILAITVNTVLGILAAAICAFLIGPVVRVLFQDVVRVPTELSLVSGAVVFLTCVSRGTGGVALVRLGGLRAITLSALCGLLVGLPAIALLGRDHGSVGAMFGEVLAETTVLAVQSVAVLIALRSLRQRGVS